MGKSLRIMVLVHPHFDPRAAKRKHSATEVDVWRALKASGAITEIATAQRDLRQFDRQLRESRPDLVFNLLEEFRGEGVFDFHLVSYLEALGIPYTGCNPRGLIVTRHKLWSMHIARGEGFAAPVSASATSRVPAAAYPLLVKYNREHASRGMTKANVVRNGSQLIKALGRLRRGFGGEVIMQEFIPGLEVSVGVWGNARVKAFSPWRLSLPSPQDIATETVKFSASYRRQNKIRAARWQGAGSERLKLRLQREATRLFALMDMNGYARFDFRVTENGEPYLIDVNANPCLAKSEDFASAARSEGVAYADLIQGLVKLGLSYQPRF